MTPMASNGASRLGTRFGPYELRSLIGVGGMGEVYRAYDTVKGREVAVKLLRAEFAADPRFQERFRRESRVAARLQEPHVIPVHDFGDIEGVLYIDMRLVEGASLKEILRTDGPLDPRRTASIVAQVASALDAAHADGLVHRDIKPENVLLTGDDFAYLVDFGIAHVGGEASVTMTGMLIGSSAYMAPERFSGDPVGPPADIYALACLVYESLIGRPPYEAGDLRQLMSAHMFSPPPRPSIMRRGIPRTFDDVIATAMAKDSAARYATAGDLARAVSAAAAGEAPPPKPTPPASGRPPTPTRQFSTVYPNPEHTGFTPYPPVYPSVPAPRPPAPAPVAPVDAARSVAAPRKRRFTRTQVLLVAATIVLFGIAAVLATMLVGGGDDASTRDTPLAPPDGATTDSSTTTSTTSNRSATANVSGTDQQGFLGHTARCDSDATPAALIRTATSLAIICERDSGDYYYRGERLRDGANLEVPDAQRSGDGFVAVNPSDGARYEVSPEGLTISSNGHIDSSEPPEEYGSK